MTDTAPPDTSSASPAIQDVYLKLFRKNNPHCEFAIEDELFMLQNPWGSKDCRLAYDLAEIEQLKDLNNVAFNSQFDAIIHVDKNEIEFIFAYLRPDEEPSQSYCDRTFTLHLDGGELTCRFAEPTERLMGLAKRVRRLPTDRGMLTVPQLEPFTDSQQLEKLPERASRYFAKRVPRSFFVKPSAPVLSLDAEHVAKHVNFIMRYYDRETPVIEIHQKAGEKCHERTEPRRFCADSFPPSLSLKGIDEFVMQLIAVAQQTSPRFAFIYYFQVIEYAGFYFVDEKARKALKSFLRDPAMITCPEDKMHDLFAVMSDLAHNDEGRMKKVVEECCDPHALWLEIENDKEFFCDEIHFDGGFVIPALLSPDTTAASWGTMWMPKVYDQLTKIRNCLVHARERRQSNVILPTETNNCRIQRYVPIIARVAEQIALKTD
ncbi:hypothetical protein ACFLQR_02895 [Verrucomicrobiota bacterium]